MKNRYERPVVVVNKELAEGVFADFSGHGCWTGTAKVQQDFNTPTEHYYRIQVDTNHNANHTTGGKPGTVTFTIIFDPTIDVNNVRLTNSQQYSLTYTGGPTAFVTRRNAFNMTENWQFAELDLYTDTVLSVGQQVATVTGNDSYKENYH